MSDPPRLDRIRRELEIRRRAHAELLLAGDHVDVDRTRAPGDAMFADDLDHYLLVGLSALHAIDVALRAAERAPGDVRRILDLPCGHGRVLRALRAVFPRQEIVACDLDRDGVDFCSATFDAVPVYSSADVERIELPGTFDLIWVGSLFTHLDAPAWGGFLRLFDAALAPGGVLVFTVAGRLVAELTRAGELGGLAAGDAARMLAAWDRAGFGYADYPAAPGYGRAIARPAWVAALLHDHLDLRLAGYTECGWDCRQDAVAVVKRPS